MNLVFKWPIGPVVLLVSGGRDSMTLLHAATVEQRNIAAVVHINYGLRPESSVEQRIVEKRCEGVGVRCFTLTADAGAVRLGNVQANARRIRIAFAESVRTIVRANWVLTGHHADDNLETAQMQQERGREVTATGMGYARGVWVRPLLGVTRNEIDQYIRLNSVSYCEDSSNSLLDYRRNQLRAFNLTANQQDLINMRQAIGVKLNETTTLRKSAYATFGPIGASIIRIRLSAVPMKAAKWVIFYLAGCKSISLSQKQVSQLLAGSLYESDVKNGWVYANNGWMWMLNRSQMVAYQTASTRREERARRNLSFKFALDKSKLVPISISTGYPSSSDCSQWPARPQTVFRRHGIPRRIRPYIRWSHNGKVPVFEDSCVDSRNVGSLLL